MSDESIELKVEQEIKVSGRKLPLGDNNEDMYFESADVLDEYIASEIDVWDWLNTQNAPVMKGFNSYLMKLFQEFIKTPRAACAAWINEDESRYKLEVEKILDIRLEWEFPSSQSITGKYIIDLSKTQLDIAIQLWFLCVSPKNFAASRKASAPLQKLYDIILKPGSSTPHQGYIYSQPQREIAATHVIKMRQLFGDESIQYRLDNISIIESALTQAKNDASDALDIFNQWVSKKQSEIVHIPEQTGQPFRANPDTKSILNRTLNPV